MLVCVCMCLCKGGLAKTIHHYKDITYIVHLFGVNIPQLMAGCVYTVNCDIPFLVISLGLFPQGPSSMQELTKTIHYSLYSAITLQHSHSSANKTGCAISSARAAEWQHCHLSLGEWINYTHGIFKCAYMMHGVHSVHSVQDAHT